MPVIPVDPKKNNQKKWRAKEEERHKGSLTHKKMFPSKIGVFGHKLKVFR
jgi:hypothetical protein